MAELKDNRGMLAFRFKASDDPWSEITVARMNAMIDAINDSMIVSVVNGFFKLLRPGRALVCSAGSSGAAKHAYFASDVSDTDPKISFKSGNHLDSGFGGSTWYPTVDGITIDTIPAPTLTIDAGDTKVYFAGTTDATTGLITAIEVNSGTSVPSSTTTNWYQLISTIAVTGSSGSYAIAILDDGVSGSQTYQKCGTNHLFGLQ